MKRRGSFEIINRAEMPPDTRDLWTRRDEVREEHRAALQELDQASERYSKASLALIAINNAFKDMEQNNVT